MLAKAMAYNSGRLSLRLLQNQGCAVTVHGLVNIDDLFPKGRLQL